MHRPTVAGPRRQARRALLAALPAAVAAAALPAAAQGAADVTAVGSEFVVEDRTGRFKHGIEDNRLVAESLPGGELRLVDQVGLIGGVRPGVPTAVDFSGGGDQGDLASYALAEEGIDVRKNDRPNDGRITVGDRDNIRTDVNIVRGTRFRDILHGQDNRGAVDAFWAGIEGRP